jgi:hypothetical protein
MPDDPSTPPQPSPAAPTQQAAEGKTDFRIGEEFGTAKKNLPPIGILAAGVVVILIAWGVAAYLQRPQTSALGAIDEVVSVEVPGQKSVMAAINVSFQNGGTKPFFIKTIKAELQTTNGNFTDDAAPAVDVVRYLQAFPALNQYAAPPLQREAKVEPGGVLKGMVVVTFPVTPDTFASRKQLTVTIQPYDQPAPLVLTK